MKRAEAKVIGTPFLQFYKTANYVYNVKTAKYLLYGVLGDHCSLYRDCEYKLYLNQVMKITKSGESKAVYLFYF